MKKPFLALGGIALVGLFLMSHELAKASLPPLDIDYVEAKYFRPANRESIKWIFIHTDEGPEGPLSAENLAIYFQNPDPRTVSAHYSVDNNSIVQSVPEADIAFTAKSPANDEGIHIELTGTALQDSAQWADAFSIAELRLAARLVAEIAKRWNIPIRFIDGNGLEQGMRGISTHAEVSKSIGKGRTDHFDPGPAFPMTEFLTMVREYV